METSVLDKIKKLLDKANSAKEIGNLDEANIFFKGIQKLLVKHNLEMSDVESHQLKDKNTIIKDEESISYKKSCNYGTWELTLAGIVARAHSCRLIYDTYFKTMRFIGTQSDVTIAKYILEVAIQTFKRICKREWKKRVKDFREEMDWHNITIDQLIRWGELPTRQKFYSSFYDGAINGLSIQYHQNEQELKQEHGNKYSMYLIKVEDQLTQFMKQGKYRKGRDHGPKKIDQDAFRKGEQVGLNFNPNKGVEGKDSMTQQLIKSF